MRVGFVIPWLLINFVDARESADGREETSEFEWSYCGQAGPNFWSKLGYSLCSGQSQSPVNLISILAVKKVVPPMYFVNYKLTESAILINTGRTVMLTVPANYSAITLGKLPLIRGGGLAADYVFQQLHFHWGTIFHPGSEHVMGFRRYPAELHLVHYNSKYGNFNNAMNNSDGLAVLSVLLKASITDNEGLNPITDALLEILKAEEETSVANPFNLIDVLPANPTSFYRYSGSLTTPGCQESVIWTVFKSPAHISIRQLRKFLLLRNEQDQPIAGNWRPTQPLNNRIVFFN